MLRLLLCSGPRAASPEPVRSSLAVPSSALLLLWYILILCCLPTFFPIYFLFDSFDNCLAT